MSELPAADPFRPRLGISEDQFVALFAYDVRSSHARKNPEAAIQAFRVGLEGKSDARLILKVSNLQSYPPAAAALAEAIDGDDRIIVFTEPLSALDMAGLIKATDVVISLHRAEGFGLLLAQSMLAGKTVIATDWSGNSEFMDNENSRPIPYKLVAVSDSQGIYRGGRWAEPDVSFAAEQIRDCYQSVSLRRAIGANAVKTIREKFGPQLDNRFRIRLSAVLSTPATHHSMPI